MENKDKVQRTKDKAQERNLDESNAVPPKNRGITVAETHLGTKQLRKTEREKNVRADFPVLKTTKQGVALVADGPPNLNACK